MPIQKSDRVFLSYDGATVVGAFCGEPVTCSVVWSRERKQFEAYDDAVHPGTPAIRVAWNFFDEAAGEMLVIDGGRVWYDGVLEATIGHDRSEWLFRVSRHGKPRDMRTRYSVEPERKIDAELRADIDAAELHTLEYPPAPFDMRDFAEGGMPPWAKKRYDDPLPPPRFPPVGATKLPLQARLDRLVRALNGKVEGDRWLIGSPREGWCIAGSDGGDVVLPRTKSHSTARTALEAAEAWLAPELEALDG